MTPRLHAARVILRRRLLESLLSPAFSGAAALALLLAVALVATFAAAVGSSGFQFTSRPLYALAGGALAGAFGEAFVDKLFAEGPALFAAYVAFVPMVVFLGLASVVRSALERRAGAVELLAYGPADGTAYFLAAFLVDAALLAGFLALLTGCLAATAAAANIVMGPAFWAGLPVMLLLALGVFAYAALATVLSDNPPAAIALFLGPLLGFAALLTATMSTVTGTPRSLISAVGAVLNWVSPLHYWSWSLRAALRGAVGVQWLCAGLLLLLTGGVLALSHVVARRRGVRP